MSFFVSPMKGSYPSKEADDLCNQGRDILKSSSTLSEREVAVIEAMIEMIQKQTAIISKDRQTLSTSAELLKSYSTSPPPGSLPPPPLDTSPSKDKAFSCQIYFYDAVLQGNTGMNLFMRSNLI